MNTIRRLARVFPTRGRCTYSRWYHSGTREIQPSKLDYDLFGGEKVIEEPEPSLTKVEESAEEFKFVEKLLPCHTVPEPPKHESYPTPSGWVPQKVVPGDLPYFIKRTRFHNYPVYLESLSGGNRKMTVVRKVDGDIWALEAELRSHLEEKVGQKMYTQVDEVCRKLRVRGMYVVEVAQFMLEKGL